MKTICNALPLYLSLVFICLSLGCSEGKRSEAVEVSPPQISYTRGPDTAELKIQQFSDFLCPYCKKQAAVFNELREKYPDKIQMTFRHFPLSGEPDVGTFPMHEASVCAAQQGKFWEFHDAVFQAEKRVTTEEVIQKIGVQNEDFSKCMAEQGGRSQVLEDLADAHLRGVSGAPTFFMNDQKVTGLRPFGYFAEKIDPEFAAELQKQRQEKKEALERQIDFNQTGRPSQGPENAPVTIIEFSDFHCFFCQKLNPVMNEIMLAYPDQIHRVWRHFPLPIHPQAPYAHVASECAHQQGKFWEFHDFVFANSSKARVGEDFKRIATDLNLDMTLFDACYENVETKKIIENDILLGFSKNVGSTPSLLINGQLVVGAQPIEKIKKIIDEKLGVNSESI